jgi:hypothetical protein
VRISLPDRWVGRPCRDAADRRRARPIPPNSLTHPYPYRVTTPDPLHHALHAPGPRPLPDEVARLLRMLDAPPRLAAHLRLVHDVAYELVEWLAVRYPGAPTGP